MKLKDVLFGLVQWDNLSAEVTSVGTLRAEAHKQLRRSLQTSLKQIKEEIDIDQESLKSGGLASLSVGMASEILEKSNEEAVDALASMILLGVGSDLNRFVRENSLQGGAEKGVEDAEELIQRLAAEILSIYTLTHALVRVTLSLVFLVQNGWPILNYSLQNAQEGGLIPESLVEHVCQSMAKMVMAGIQRGQDDLSRIQMKQNREILSEILSFIKRKEESDNDD